MPEPDAHDRTLLCVAQGHKHHARWASAFDAEFRRLTTHGENPVSTAAYAAAHAYADEHYLRPPAPRPSRS